MKVSTLGRENINNNENNGTKTQQTDEETKPNTEHQHTQTNQARKQQQKKTKHTTTEQNTLGGRHGITHAAAQATAGCGEQLPQAAYQRRRHRTHSPN